MSLSFNSLFNLEFNIESIVYGKQYGKHNGIIVLIKLYSWLHQQHCEMFRMTHKIKRYQINHTFVSSVLESFKKIVIVTETMQGTGNKPWPRVRIIFGIKP